MAYAYLAIAIVAEVIATSAMEASKGLTKLTPSIIVVVGYSISFYLIAQILKVLPVGITYAIWCGAGIVLVAIVGMVVNKQTPDIFAVLGMLLIMSGIVVIKLFSKT